jgi:uncharacterized protein with PIN domain
MGNLFSFYNRKIDVENQCLVCWKVIDKKDLVVKCVRCGILLHSHCEEIYRNEREFTICPGCKRIGSLGIIDNSC